MIDFINLPDTSTPLTADNLNLMQQISTGETTIASGTTITNGYEVTLPLYYQVGNNSLELRLDSEVLVLATDTSDGHYKEVRHGRRIKQYNSILSYK